MSLNLGAWLRKTPQPHIVVADEKRIHVGNKGGKWRDMVRTIESLKATEISCLDSAGNIIRATTIDDGDDDEKPAAPPVKMHGGCPTCGVNLATFAGLLAEAYEKGSNAQRDAYRTIFEENTKLVRLLADRLSRLEVMWQGALHNQAELVEQVAEANANAAAAAAADDGGIGGALIAGMLQGQQAAVPAVPATVPARNGKAARK